MLEPIHRVHVNAQKHPQRRMGSLCDMNRVGQWGRASQAFGVDVARWRQFDRPSISTEHGERLVQLLCETSQPRQIAGSRVDGRPLLNQLNHSITLVIDPSKVRLVGVCRVHE